MHVQNYLMFEGRLEEALDFYQSALGAKVTALMRFKEAPDPPPPGMLPPGMENKIMHSEFQVGETRILASDGLCNGELGFKGFSLALQLADEAEARRLYAALAEGGRMEMPLAKTFWSPLFGMVVDRFGVSWMVNVEQ